MIKIKIHNIEKYYDQGKGKTFTVTLNPGFTCLVGPNGTGKTTMLQQIKYTLMEERDKESGNRLYEIAHYDNQKDGGSKKFGLWLYQKDGTEKIAEMMSSSEGEGIIFNLGEFALQCGKATKTAIERNRNLIILIDGFDSGTSIDKIYQFKREFVDGIIEHCKSEGIEVYIIATANNYAMVDNIENNNSTDCIVAATGKHRTFKSYNLFRKFILSNAKEN